MWDVHYGLRDCLRVAVSTGRESVILVLRRLREKKFASVGWLKVGRKSMLF